MWGTHPLASETGVRGRRATIWWIVGPYVWLVLPALAAWRLWGAVGLGSQPGVGIERVGAGIVVVGVVACAQGLVLWRVIRVRRELRSGHGCFCLHCGHSLVGLESIGCCPECGRSYEIRAVRSMWRSVVGPFDRSGRRLRRRSGC